ncbi:MAG: polyprenyl synthetase family protein, partial [Methanothrix sp.]
LVRDLPDSPLEEILSYVLSAPGKRVRPLILILSAEALGTPPAQSISAALAIELVHAASLVHDDILDHGIERRGSPSALERFGPEASLLAGDWLISRSIDLISGYSQPVIQAFSRACMDMSEGELMDLSCAGSPEDYYQCITRKTASLFSASAKIGGLISGAGKEDVARLESYGLHLGLGYQVLDDLEEFLGLDQGKSSQKTSVTLPMIYASRNPLAASPDTDSDATTALQMCIKVIDDHCNQAKRALQALNGEEEKKLQLLEIVDEMTCRGLQRCRSQKSLC